MTFPFETLEAFVEHLASYDGAPRVGYKFWRTRDLDVAEIAKLIRQDIAELCKDEVLPKVKFSVRIERYAGGQSISIVCPEPPKGARGPHDPASVRLTLQRVLDSYNYDGSHGMYDWTNRRFHDSLTFRKAEA